MDESLYHQFYKVEQQHWWFVARQDILLAFIKEIIKLPPEAFVLDVGCGTGAMLDALSQLYAAYGVDFSPIAVEYCRKRGLSNVFCGNLGDIPVNKKFDLLTFLDVIEHIDDDLGILRQGWSLLKPEGSILVTVPAYQWLWSKHDELNQHKRRYTMQKLVHLVEKAGYTVRHSTYFNTFLFPLAVLRRTWGTIADRWHDDLALPSPLINNFFRGIFRAEKLLVQHMTLPFGVSILCHASKARSRS